MYTEEDNLSGITAGRECVLCCEARRRIMGEARTEAISQARDLASSQISNLNLLVFDLL